MHKKFSLFLFILIITNDIVYGKHRNKNKAKADAKYGAIQTSNNRVKRSIFLDVEQKGNAEKRKYYSNPKPDKEPFWGTRGRRDSSEEVVDIAPKYFNNDEYRKFNIPNYNTKREDDEETPFWGNRGRRNSDESEEMLYNLDNSLYKERRQEDDPFWGTRGRRKYTEGRGNLILDTDDPPFWGNRGRREESEPFWGTRGRREESEPFWGTRGRREESEPFWGTRGRRAESEPFWGTRGRRQDEPFWANRGRGDAETMMDNRRKIKIASRVLLNDETEPFWGNRGRRRLKIKNSILKAIYDVKDSIDDLIQQKRESNRNRHMLPKAMKNMSPQEKLAKLVGNELVAKKSDQKTVLDDRIYAEEPHYIIVERSSRSSGEFDPFYISRGKKFSNLDFNKSVPSRRGALEDLVKSVRNDPFYIARGKKDNEKKKNATTSDVIDKNVFCMIVEQMLNKNKVKRKVTERSDRDRRTILKNLALKLQMDPYYVSRGKKDSEEGVFGSKENFFDRLVAKCN